VIVVVVVAIDAHLLVMMIIKMIFPEDQETEMNIPMAQEITVENEKEEIVIFPLHDVMLPLHDVMLPLKGDEKNRDMIVVFHQQNEMEGNINEEVNVTAMKTDAHLLATMIIKITLLEDKETEMNIPLVQRILVETGEIIVISPRVQGILVETGEIIVISLLIQGILVETGEIIVISPLYDEKNKEEVIVASHHQSEMEGTMKEEAGIEGEKRKDIMKEIGEEGIEDMKQERKEDVGDMMMRKESIRPRGERENDDTL